MRGGRAGPGRSGPARGRRDARGGSGVPGALNQAALTVRFRHVHLYGIPNPGRPEGMWWITHGGHA